MFIINGYIFFGRGGRHFLKVPQAAPTHATPLIFSLKFVYFSYRKPWIIIFIRTFRLYGPLLEDLSFLWVYFLHQNFLQLASGNTGKKFGTGSYVFTRSDQTSPKQSVKSTELKVSQTLMPFYQPRKGSQIENLSRILKANVVDGWGGGGWGGEEKSFPFVFGHLKFNLPTRPGGARY